MDYDGKGHRKTVGVRDLDLEKNGEDQLDGTCNK